VNTENYRMQITEMDIAFVKPKDGLIAFASVALDDQLFLSGIAIQLDEAIEAAR
jgi:hypothetical protein